MVDNFKEQKELEKRIEKAKDVLIVFTKVEDNLQFFSVTDKDGNEKYTSHFDVTIESEHDHCTCKSFENGNNSKAGGYYPATHGHAFQCKHLIQARDEYKKQHESIELIDVALVKDAPHNSSLTLSDTLKPKDTTFYESSMIQKDLLLD